MKIVADTNLLIASIFWSGAPYRIVQLALGGKIEIFTSLTILNEVRKVLKDPEEGFRITEQEIDDVVEGIMIYAHLTEPNIKVDVVRDPKDNPIIECALTASADYIVTRDKDILVLKQHEGIRIVTPEGFLALFKQSD